MKPFALHALLKHRERLKNIARNKFQAARNEHTKVLQQLTMKQHQEHQLRQALEAKQIAGIEIKEQQLFDHRITYIQGEMSQLAAALQRKQTVLVREKTYLLEKSKEHRAIKRLQEKQDAAWRNHLVKKESAMLDEIAVLYRNKERR